MSICLVDESDSEGSMGKYALKDAVRRRWEFIEFCLNWEGKVGRKRLQEAFSISPQQATNDLNGYADLAPANMHYDPRQKTYVRSEKFSPVLSEDDPHNYLNYLIDRLQNPTSRDNWIDYTYRLEGIVPRRRQVSGAVIREITKGLREGRLVSAKYVSLTSESQTQEKEIVPVAMGYDGHRWHVRAYNISKDRFSDYVLSRFASVHAKEIYPDILPDDADWSETVEIHLKPNSELSEERRNAIEFEYDMTNGELVLNVKRAMLFYHLRHYGFNPFPSDDGKMRNESSFSLVIENIDEIEAALRRR